MSTRQLDFRSLVLGIVLISTLGFADQTPEKHGTTMDAPKFLDLRRRPADTIEVLTGTIIIKNEYPFLATDDGKLYKVETCDTTCKAQIDSCKQGERCEIRAEVKHGVNPYLIVKSLTVVAPAEETKTTKSGVVFRRDYNKKRPNLSESWRDPRGVLWGDIVKNEDGSPHYMNHKDATDYCLRHGAELPTPVDFSYLNQYMAEKSGSFVVYTPQVLPNLTYVKNGKTYTHFFWSSEVVPYITAYSFNGNVRQQSSPGENKQAVRCVSVLR